MVFSSYFHGQNKYENIYFLPIVHSLKVFNIQVEKMFTLAFWVQNAKISMSVLLKVHL
jgi:hypothetical protein